MIKRRWHYLCMDNNRLKAFRDIPPSDAWLVGIICEGVVHYVHSRSDTTGTRCIKTATIEEAQALGARLYGEITAKVPSCQHEPVNVGFMHRKMVCKKCDLELPVV